MKKKLLLVFIGTIGIIQFCSGQTFHPADNQAFLQNEVASIYITIDADSIANMLLQSNLSSDHEYPADFEYRSSLDTTIITNVGFRLRGNTSRYAEKKSFKISFNSFVSGLKWQSLEKLNLNGQHNDVSILRNDLALDLLKAAQLPASRKSYVKLYINNEYKGLYLNTEHIDEEFIQSRFPLNDNGNLYKANYGANMLYTGTNQSPYESLYELSTNKSANDYSGLIHFLDILNNTNTADFACEIDAVFDVDMYLRTLAIEILSGHWDGYAFNKNNYYLYQRPSDQKFVFIEYDMDNTFGIDWSGIDWANRNIYNWASTNDARPLYTKILNVPYYRNQFSLYVDNYLSTFYNPANLVTALQAKQTLIEQAAYDDTYRTLDYGFNNFDFQYAITDTWGAHITTSIESFLYDRKISANQQTTTSTMQNPCFNSIENATLETPLQFVKAFNLLGQEIDVNTPNQWIIGEDQFGNHHKIFSK
jgi:hypothetical protein